ncbi:MAG: hypothetical protein ACRDTR_01290, partial [Rubrobacter sp.]
MALATARTAVLLLAILLLAGACSGDPEDGQGEETDASTRQTETGDTTSSPNGGPETTGDVS